MKFILAFLLCFIPLISQAEENIPLKIAGNLLLLADWNQTRQIAGHPEKWYETNIILGKHPSKKKVDIYFASVILGVNTLDYFIDNDKISNGLWIGVTILEGSVVYHNYGLGIKVRF